jgi:CrcB protein
MGWVVFVGAGLGGVIRFALGGWIQEAAGAGFPWGTFFINVTGSLGLGFLYALLEGTPPRPAWRAFVGVGFCGGYTTFSTFSYETARLVHDGQWPRAMLYGMGSMILALIATFAGFNAAAAILRRG